MCYCLTFQVFHLHFTGIMNKFIRVCNKKETGNSDLVIFFLSFTIWNTQRLTRFCISGNKRKDFVLLLSSEKSNIQKKSVESVGVSQNNVPDFWLRTKPTPVLTVRTCFKWVLRNKIYSVYDDTTIHYPRFSFHYSSTKGYVSVKSFWWFSLFILLIHFRRSEDLTKIIILTKIWGSNGKMCYHQGLRKV